MAQQIVRVEFSADISDYHAEQLNSQSVARIQGFVIWKGMMLADLRAQCRPQSWIKHCADGAAAQGPECLRDLHDPISWIATNSFICTVARHLISLIIGGASFGRPVKIGGGLSAHETR